MIIRSEHYGFKEESFDELSEEICVVLAEKTFNKHFEREKNKQLCFAVHHIEKNKYRIESSYMIGIDWIVENKLPIYIQPKLNTEETEIDYLSMLFEALQEPDNFKHLDGLYTIDFSTPLIEIEQYQDALTPLLLIEFLQLLKQIVRKGLKKSYYKVTKNLNARVKGKILLNATVKQNHTKQKILYNVCQYEEFGYNSIENRILKKALLFTQSMLNNLEGSSIDFEHLFHYVNPVFQLVDANISLKELKNTKSNPLFREYNQALKLAKIILKKYGYNISKTTETKIKTPPFWIDMSKLFEMYTYKKLRELFSHKGEIIYHKTFNYLEPDYILKSNDGQYKMVIDAKYKPRYKDKNISKEDIRQVSGYARLKTIYDELIIENYNEVIDCLIIYSDQSIDKLDIRKEDLTSNENKDYVKFYKMGIKLPTISKSNINL